MSETFEKGDIVECVNPGANTKIRLGGQYTVASMDRRLGVVRFRTDGGGAAHYDYAAHRFRLVSRAAKPQATEADPTAKPSNPKDAIGSGKLPLHLWPPIASAFGAIGLLHGMLKYGRTNWRAAGVRASIYRDAMHRHIDDWFEGNDADEDGCDNLGAVLACAAILLDAREAGKLVDDRQFAGGFYRAAKERLTGQVARLKALHAGKDPKHWTIADNERGV